MATLGDKGDGGGGDGGGGDGGGAGSRDARGRRAARSCARTFEDASCAGGRRGRGRRFGRRGRLDGCRLAGGGVAGPWGGHGAGPTRRVGVSEARSRPGRDSEAGLAAAGRLRAPRDTRKAHC